MLKKPEESFCSAASRELQTIQRIKPTLYQLRESKQPPRVRVVRASSRWTNDEPATAFSDQ